MFLILELVMSIIVSVEVITAPFDLYYNRRYCIFACEWEALFQAIKRPGRGLHDILRLAVTENSRFI
jgi:hypothetical protein